MTTKTKYPLLVAALVITLGIGHRAGAVRQGQDKPTGGGGTPSQDKPNGGGGTPSKGKSDRPGGGTAKETRFEGKVERSSKEKSSLTIRKVGGNLEKTCVYDSSTKWVSQYHGDKKVNDIDASQIKDGDYVICEGTSDSAGIIHSTLISRRLSHSPE